MNVILSKSLDIGKFSTLYRFYPRLPVLFNEPHRVVQDGRERRHHKCYRAIQNAEKCVHVHVGGVYWEKPSGER